MGCRKPSVQGKHARLHPKSDQHQHGGNQKDAAVLRYCAGAEHASCTEGEGVSIAVDKIQAEQSHVCPAQGIK